MLHLRKQLLKNEQIRADSGLRFAALMFIYAALTLPEPYAR